MGAFAPSSRRRRLSKNYWTMVPCSLSDNRQAGPSSWLACSSLLVVRVEVRDAKAVTYPDGVDDPLVSPSPPVVLLPTSDRPIGWSHLLSYHIRELSQELERAHSRQYRGGGGGGGRVAERERALRVSEIESVSVEVWSAHSAALTLSH